MNLEKHIQCYYMCEEKIDVFFCEKVDAIGI